jgi:hypothetical protein
MTDFEDDYLDVLQNIEFGIVTVYQADRSLLDAHAASALEGLMRTYQAEARGRAAPHLNLSSQAQTVFDSVKAMCEWRLGREHVVDAQGVEMGLDLKPLTPNEIVACLKRIRKSVEMWTRRNGRQGYLNFVSQFVK